MLIKSTNTYSTVTRIIWIGVLGRSCRSVLALLIASTTSWPSTTRPKTGCWEGVLLSKKSKKLLWTVLIKNWDPPEFGWPVLAMESVKGSLLNLGHPSINNFLNQTRVLNLALWTHPECIPLCFCRSFDLQHRSYRDINQELNEDGTYLVPGCGPPVPALLLVGSRECGQPNWFIKLGMTRWKWSPL